MIHRVDSMPGLHITESVCLCDVHKCGSQCHGTAYEHPVCDCWACGSWAVWCTACGYSLLLDEDCLLMGGHGQCMDYSRQITTLRQKAGLPGSPFTNKDCPRWKWSELEPGEPQNGSTRTIMTDAVGPVSTAAAWFHLTDRTRAGQKYQLKPWTGQVFDNNIPINVTLVNMTLWTDERIAAKRAELMAAGAVPMRCTDELGEERVAFVEEEES